jgi:hypothetical protein
MLAERINGVYLPHNLKASPLYGLVEDHISTPTSPTWPSCTWRSWGEQAAVGRHFPDREIVPDQSESGKPDSGQNQYQKPGRYRKQLAEENGS